MKVLFDIGHPAHVHLFRNPREILLDRGHTVHMVAREKEMARSLLRTYGIDFFPGSTQRNGMGMVLELFEWFYRVRRLIGGLDIDVVVSVGSPAGAWASRVQGIPHLAFNDTESASLQRILYKPVVTRIYTPSCYSLDLGRKHERYEGYHELSYLRPRYFDPDPEVLGELGVEEGERYTILRFVGWQASHDVGHKGLSNDTKLSAVERFGRFGKVFVSSERRLSGKLERFKIGIPPERIHHALAFATLLYGESATMASECSVLGTPAIYLDDDGRGYTDEQEKRYGMVFNFSESRSDQEASISKGEEILEWNNAKQEWAAKRDRLLAEKIDVARYIADRIEDTVERN
ncbi:hypothetical protein GF402_04855 [Candidatus Fermentibacteria bacterium]|nr:hypothetical protein [Candidatus Fermentibacteria bacterium]